MTSDLGHFRRIDVLATLAACPLNLPNLCNAAKRRFVPKGDIRIAADFLLDHLVGAGEQRRRQVEAEHTRRGEAPSIIQDGRRHFR